MSKMELMKTMVVNINTDQAKTILMENCEHRNIGSYFHLNTALLVDLKDSLTLDLYWRYRKPEVWDSFQNRQIIPTDCYICDEHGAVSFRDLGEGTTLIEIYKVVEINRKLMRNLFGFLIMPIMVIGINWDFFCSLFPFHLSSLPQLILWISVLIFLEWFVWMTGLVPAEQRSIDAYKCIQSRLDCIFEKYKQ